MAQANISFGGITGIRGMCGSLSRGVLPSAFSIYCLPQDNFDPGINTLSFGLDSNQISLTGCVVAGAYVRKHWDNKWPLWSVPVLDRRWKWRFSSISGDYNRRKPDGTLDTATQQTPGQLATLLGTALGETIDVSRMPTGVWPKAKWNNQRADLALQWLCDYVCCEVVLNPVSGGVEVWPLGYGSNTPTGTTEMLPKYRLVPRANIPSRIELHGGDSLWQSRLKLSSVLRNQSDSKQKLSTNSELITSAALATESPWSLPSQTDNAKRALEYEGLWRDYRVMGQQDGSLVPPNCQTAVSAIDQYILNDYRLDYETDIEGYSRQLPYYLDGDFYAYTDLPNNASSMRFNGGSTLYKDRRVVNTDFPVFKLSSSGAYAEPALYLTTSYKIQDNGHNLVHVMRSGGAAGNGGTLIVRRPEVFATYSTANTESQANNELDNYTTLFQQRYSNPLASEITYGGFYSGSLDGVLAQVTWTIHPAIGMETKVCENEELDIYSISRNERYRRMALDRLVEAMA